MKEIKKIINLTKQFFVFSRVERKGIIVLLFLVVGITMSPQLYRMLYPPAPLDITITDLGALASVGDTNDTDAVTAVGDKPDVAPVRFYFNPNTIDSVGLTKLGFTPKIAGNIIKYRLKGGDFKQAQDLYRIYGVDSAFILSILPYAQFSKESAQNNRFTEKYNQEKKTKGPIDLNTADSLQLVSLYGIGPKMAVRIIDYRQRTGGFFNTQQLLEVYGMDEDVLLELEGKIYVDLAQIRYLHINSVTLDELKKNPHVKTKLANAIINYRAQHGHFKQVEDLKKIVIMQDSTYHKLLPYLRLN